MDRDLAKTMGGVAVALGAALGLLGHWPGPTLTLCPEPPELEDNLARLLQVLRRTMEHSEVSQIMDLRFPLGRSYPAEEVWNPMRWAVPTSVRPWDDVDVELRFPSGWTAYRYGWRVAATRGYRSPLLPWLRARPMDVDAQLFAACELPHERMRFVWRDYWHGVDNRWRLSRIAREDRDGPPPPLYDRPDPRAWLPP